MDTAAAPSQVEPEVVLTPCPHCGAVPTLADAIEKRIAVPATISELAAIFGKKSEVISGTLHSLKRQGRAEKLDRRIEVDKSCRQSRRGPAHEYLWQRKYLDELK